MQGSFIEGLVKYPDDLPCPQADTDLVPRERRYISDISDVRNMRMFQQEFQATRNRITFIFTEEEVRQFREWYEVEIIFGGAWFYADWPTLHKDKKIAHRFVGQPKYEWLFGGNPGVMGRSSAGVKYAQAPMAVPMYKVTATVELYDPRKVGKTANVFTSKLYPLLPTDHVDITVPSFRRPPFYKYADRATVAVPEFTGSISGIIEPVYIVDDLQIPEVLLFGSDFGRIYDQYFTLEHPKLSGKATIYTYKELHTEEHSKITIPQFTGYIAKWLITYDYYNEDKATVTVPTIISGEMQ